MAENQKHTNRLLKSNVKIDIKSRKKRVRHRHCGTIREPLPSFKKLSTLRNQGAFFISKIRLSEFVQTVYRCHYPMSNRRINDNHKS
mgnify:CR=1 FL=1